MSSETYYGTGRRKTSTARVYLRPGSGEITVNSRPLDDFFGRKTARMIVRQPLEVANAQDKFDIAVTVRGVDHLVWRKASGRTLTDSRSAGST